MDRVNGQRPRILLLAFMCSPDHGSEWANGWNRALQCAKHFDTWVICQGNQQATEITRFLEAHGRVPGLHFEFIPYDACQRPSHVMGIGWLSYNLWHRKAFRTAQQLHAKLRFDLVHQVTNSGFREPSYLWKLDTRFVWGPVGGTHNYPGRFLLEAGFPYGLFEAARSLINSAQLNFSRRGRLAARRASALLVANTTIQEQFQRAHGVHSVVMCDVGVAHVPDSARDFRDGCCPLRILWSGQFISRKALPLLLKALAVLPADVAYELRVLGDGPLDRRWKRLADQLGISNRIEWLGWLPHEQAQQQYPWADIFVFTGLRDNSGTVVLEALANGLPVVCLDHQGVFDIVTQRCGVKVPVISPRQVIDDLRRVLARLAHDRESLAALSEAAPARARDYLWSRLGAQMIDVYREVLEAGERETRQPESSTSMAPHQPHGMERNGSSNGALGPHRQAPGISAPAVPQVAGPAATFPRSRLLDSVTWSAQRVAVGLDKLFGKRPGAGIGILMYHRVAEESPGFSTPTSNVTPRRMRIQLEGLLAHGFQAWSLRALVAACTAGQEIPRNVFAVTFDDGYENNLLHALPILEELRVPGTIFLATGFLDSDRPFPCDNWSGAGQPGVPTVSWRPLTTDQCRELQTHELIDLGAHTHTHQNFGGRVDAFRRDLSISLDVMRDRLGISQPTFSFPFGVTVPGLFQAAQELGVTCALSTRSVCVDPATDPFHWGRFSADSRDTVATLVAKLNGWYTPVADVLRKIKRPVATFAPKAIGELVAHSKPSSVVDRNGAVLSEPHLRAVVSHEEHSQS